MPAQLEATSSSRLLFRGQSVFIILGGIYAALVLLLAVPVIQTGVVYLNKLNFPLNAQWDVPEKYGLAPGKTLNLNLQTSDNVSIGAWFILAEGLYHPLPQDNVTEAWPSLLPSALSMRPTVLYLHGNAMNRAYHSRIKLYGALTSRLRANVLAIDYRGFGNSEGSPTEEGLALDARAAWDWLTFNGARPEDILLAGHSLGTAVATRLAVSLSQEQIAYRGLVLMSPFSSITTLLDTYHLFGFIPLMSPLRMIRGASGVLIKFLIHKFDTLSIINDVKAPILIAHADNDWEIPKTHAETLFNALLASELPQLPAFTDSIAPSLWSEEQWAQYKAQSNMRSEVIKEAVTRHAIVNFGIVEEFRRTFANAGKVVLVRSQTGEHDRIGSLEGVQDIIRSAFGFEL